MEYSTPWPSPPPDTVSADSPVSLGLEFLTTDPVWAVALEFYRGGTGITGPVTGALYAVTGGGTGTLVPGSEAEFVLDGVGWLRADLAEPVELTPGQHYKAVVHFPSGYTATGSYFTSGEGAAGFVNGPLTVLDAIAATDGQCSYGYGAAMTYPIGSAGGNYWVDVVVDDDPGGGDVIVGAGAATVALLASGVVSKTAAGAGGALVALAASGVASSIRRGVGAANLDLTAAGAGRRVAARAGSAVVDLAAAGVGRKVAVRSGTATVALTAGGLTGNQRDITVTVVPLPSRWSITPAVDRWTMEV